jgi:DNA-binding protein HU-beta
MKKAELVDALASAADLNKSQVDAMLEALPGVILGALNSHGSLTLPGVAKIEARARPERKARNPATGAEITIAATTVAGFKPVKPFKEAVAKVKA